MPCCSPYYACIPQRFIFTIMACLGIMFSYIMRMCLNVALTEMVGTKLHNGSEAEQYCPEVEGQSEKYRKGQYNWNENQQQAILSSFYGGYFIMHIPGGIIADKLSGKHTFGTSIVLSVVFTLLTPLTVRWGGWQLLTASRVCVGLAQGAVFPSCAQLCSRWLPLSERGILVSLIYGGIHLGSICGTLFSGLMLHHKDWEFMFYMWGMMGMVWYIAFIICISSEPGTHPCISESELAFIKSETVIKENYKIPWGKFFSDKVVWALVFGEFGHDLLLFAVVTEMPKYLHDILRFDVQSNGALSCLPYLALWLANNLAGLANDYITKRNLIPIRIFRPALTSFGNMVPGITLVAVGFVGCSRYVAVAMFVISMFTMGPYYPGLKLNSLEVSANFQGTLMSLVNGIGALAGYVAPYALVLLAPDNTIGQWRLVFFVVVGISWAVTILYAFLTSTERAQWDYPPASAPSPT